MPITDTRNIVQFVNDLESRINNLDQDLLDWENNKTQILNALPQINLNRTNAITAIVKAEDALAELNTATYGVVAAKGQRLKKLLDDLKAQVIEIAENAPGKGVEIDSYIQDEINNAIAGVDSAIHDGLKLDYRIRQVQDMAQEGVEFAQKEIILPFSHKTINPLNHYEVQLEPQEGVEYVRGDLTVLDASGDRVVLGTNQEAITGTVYESGLIILSESPKVPVTLIYPARLNFNDVPEDFLYYTLQMMLSKSSPTLTFVQKVESIVTEILTDVRYMKGTNWTVDHSIMRNRKDILLESITPKGLQVDVQNGNVHAMFSYNDHPNLKHFVLEKLNPETNEFEPYDGAEGIISK
ncbi:hypothetical protein PUW25_26365 (plasmid) [Paenibacillus urinalis]|uniref:Uncharacterized protein n=1 Tax=Paenibacillus urinalis TaxID=521520 RepID=A0ABY7XKM8_9BACL|nr:hypothetical protein [Paenibacillus urinalis]WDI05097.1 hypothetical protein PUW25_26365 [Paenibacillus urinalis]